MARKTGPPVLAETAVLGVLAYLDVEYRHWLETCIDIRSVDESYIRITTIVLDMANSRVVDDEVGYEQGLHDLAMTCIQVLHALRLEREKIR